MRLLVGSQNSLARCRWEHHFNWNGCHLVRELAIIASPASQNVVIRVLGILREKVRFFGHAHRSSYGGSVYQNTTKQEEIYNEQAVILLYMFQCVLYVYYLRKAA